MSRYKQIILILLIPTLIFALESFIKYYLILNKIPKSGFYFFGRLFQIGFFTNINLAFGLPLPQFLIIIFVIIILLALCYFWWFSLFKTNIWQIFALSLIILGALSNVLDRLIFGFVIDYVNIFIWPVFNLADCMIVVGVLTYILSLFKLKKNLNITI